MTKACWIITYDDETIQGNQQKFEDVLNDFIKGVDVVDIKFTSMRDGLAAMVIYEA